ncbi:MAG: hypothetical protein M3179_10585 [Actinomycetota bacterium]|nr:hypothetical protein [Actinomycetota bacterium]
MIVLLIILVVAAVGGVAAYVVMQYAGVDSKVPSTSGTSGFHSGFIERRGGSVAERIANTPSGCLVAVLIAAAVWIALWLVVLVLGLRVLTA